MSGKFMKIKKIIVPTITMVIMASQLMGCAAVSQSELLQMINNGDQIEIEVASPAFAEAEQGTESSILWEQLALLNTNQTLRSSWDDTLGIMGSGETKNGILYVNAIGEQEANNTLRVVLHNREFQKFIENESSMLELAEAVANQYADIEPDETEKAVYMGINGYFNLLPDNEVNYCNADSTLQRNEFMAMLFRAETPVEELTADSNFTTAVGKSDLNIYAQGVADSSYLDIESKSLDNMTYNGTITRAEAIYMLVQRYFSDDFNEVETNGVTFMDAQNGGNIAESQQFIEDGKQKDHWKSYELTYALQNPDNGLPTDLFKALVVAKDKGLVGSETRWDEALTKAEAVELLINTYKADESIETFNYTQGITQDNSVNGIQYNKDGEVVAEKSEMDAVMNQEDSDMDEPVIEDAEPIIEETTDFEVETLSPTTLYAIRNVNLRQGSNSDDFDKVGSLSSRQKVTVTGVVKQYKDEDTLWYQLDSGEFVAGSYLVETLPAEQPQAPSGGENPQPAPTQPSAGADTVGGLKIPGGNGGLTSGQTSGQATAEGSGNYTDINLQ